LTLTHRHSRLRALAPAVLAFLLSAALLLCGAGLAHAADITSNGPLTDIGVGTDLSCSVNYTGDVDGEFFGDDACGTFLDVGGDVANGGTVYGAPNLPAGESVASTPFTEDGQTPVSGIGSGASPYTISTQVDAGNTGVSLTQTDMYVTGSDYYSSTDLLTNNSPSPQTVVLYHAADCYLGNADVGYGYQDPASGGVFCTKTAENNPAGRVEGFIPTVGGSNYLETGYNQNWATVGLGDPLPDTCDCDTFEDNGMSISWTVTIPAGGGATRSWETDFSPVGNIQASSYVALGDSVAAGEGIGYDLSWDGSAWQGGNGSDWDTTSGVSDPDCHQTLSGYPHDLAAELNSQLLDLACTSAGTLNGVLNPQSGKSVPAQLSGAYDDANPDIVTLTVGADDIDFRDKVFACYAPFWDPTDVGQGACGTSSDRATLSSEVSSFQHNLTNVLNQIKDRGEQAGKVPVVGLTEYYSPFPNSYPSPHNCTDISPRSGIGITLTDSEMQYLEWGEQQLNSAIAAVGRQFANVVVVPPPPAFAQHRWCSADPWVYGPSIAAPTFRDWSGNGSQAPFHPTAEGQQAIADNIAQYLQDERHVVPGSQVPLTFGDINLVINAVQTAGTAFLTALSDLGDLTNSRGQVEGAHRVMTAAALRAATVNPSDSVDSATGLPPGTDFDPVQYYSAGTSAEYTGGMTVTLPSLGASVLYEDINDSWQQIPTTSDGSGNLTATLTTLAPLALGNPAPAVSAAFTTSGDGGQAPDTVSFDASGSTVQSGSIASYSWDFGDGSDGSGQTASHVYNAAGTYTVTLTTTSDQGATDITSQTVTVNDAAPTAVVSLPTTATVGQPVTGDASGSTAADGGGITDTYWDFGDGSDPVDSPTTSHSYAAPGTYTVTTAVMDDEGQTTSTTSIIVVTAANTGGGIALTLVKTGPGPTRMKLTIAKRVRFEHDRLIVKVSCGKTGRACSGRLRLVVRHGHKTTTVATARLRLRAGQHRTLRLRPRKSVKASVTSAKAISVKRLSLNRTTFTATLKLIARR
jgi:PKD repeat protein/lysophospholipase L1-like esterase